MDVGRAFKFVFDDPRWVMKLLIGGLLVVATSLLGWVLPIVGQVLSFVGGLVMTGYTLALVRRVADGYDTPLPEWDDWQGLFVLGVKGFVVQIGWALPLLLVALVLLLPGITTENTGLIAVGSLLFLVFAIPVALVAPAGQGRLAVTGSIREGLLFGQIVRMVRGNLGDYVLLVLLAIVAALIALAGVVLLVLPALLTVPYAMLVVAHLTGQAYFRSASTLPAPAATGQPFLEP